MQPFLHRRTETDHATCEMSQEKERRTVFRDGFEYLLDDDDRTAWIQEGNSGGARVYVMPEKVEIDGVTYTITSVEFNAYNTPLDTGLEELYFTDGYEYFDEYAFGRSPLKKIRLGKGLRYYMQGALRSAADDVRMEIDPDNPYIKMSNDGHSVLSKDGKELIYVIHDVEELVIPEGVESIAGCAIMGKTRMRTVRLPSSLKRIAVDGMIDNSRLESLLIPEGVEEIGCQAFCGNASLTSADFPSTLAEMDSETFLFDRRLACLTLRSPTVVNVNFQGRIWYEEVPLETCRLVVPKRLIPEYRKDPFWGWIKQIDPIEEIDHV